MTDAGLARRQAARPSGSESESDESTCAKEKKVQRRSMELQILASVVVVVGSLSLLLFSSAGSTSRSEFGPDECPGNPKINHTIFEEPASYVQWLQTLANELNDKTLKAQWTYVYDFHINRPRTKNDMYNELELWIPNDGNQTDSLDSVDENTTYSASDTEGFVLTSLYPLDKLGGTGLGYAYKAGDFGWETHYYKKPGNDSSEDPYYDGPQDPEREDIMIEDRFSNHPTVFHNFFRLTIQSGEICKDTHIRAHVEHDSNEDKAATDEANAPTAVPTWSNEPLTAFPTMAP